MNSKTNKNMDQQLDASSIVDKINKKENSVITLVASIWEKLGDLPGKISAKTTKGANDLVKDLKQDFGLFLEQYQVLATAHKRLQKEFDDNSHLTGLMRSKLEEHDKLSDRITTLMERQSKHLVEIMEKTVSSSVGKPHQNLPFTFTETLQFPPLPTNDKPSLIISSKEDDTSIREVQKILNQLDMKEIPQIECAPTRGGKLIVACNSKQDLDNVKEKLESNEEINNVIHVAERKPRRLRVIVFGAPEAPAVPKKEQEKDTNFQNYINNIIKPALSKHLRKEDTPFKLIRVLKSRPNEAASHLVLELDEKDAMIFLTTRPCLGFNRCSVKRYATVIRCYKCQKIGHSTRSCPNDTVCAYCAGQHHVDDCPRTDQPTCVNCAEEIKDKGGARQAGVYPHHPSYDSRCTTYRRQLEGAIQALKKPIIA